MMIEFQLFRIKVYSQNTMPLFNQQSNSKPLPKEILRETILKNPEGELNGGIKWIIGDVEEIDKSSLYFRIAKTTKVTIINEETTVTTRNDVTIHNKHFKDTEQKTNPYTHAIIDIEDGVLAIGKKTSLSRKTTGIAQQLERLINSNVSNIMYSIRTEISPIKDPEEFLEYIKSAHSISIFTLNFSLPNPLDAEKDFVKPAQNLLSSINGENGKVILRGNRLNAENLTELTRSAASTGDDASVTYRESEDAAPITKSLHGHSVIKQFNSSDIDTNKKSIIERIRLLYRSIRGKNKTQ